MNISVFKRFFNLVWIKIGRWKFRTGILSIWFKSGLNWILIFELYYYLKNSYLYFLNFQFLILKNQQFYSNIYTNLFQQYENHRINSNLCVLNVSRNRKFICYFSVVRENLSRLISVDWIKFQNLLNNFNSFLRIKLTI